MTSRTRKPTLKEQWTELKREAHCRGLRVRKADNVLNSTPYRAMNPRAAKLLKQPCPPKTIIYSLSSRRPVHRKIMDVRHELIEHEMINELCNRGVPPSRLYPTAHQVANRKQNSQDAFKR